MANAHRWWEGRSLIPFKASSSLVVNGPTGVGKTWWVYRLLRHHDVMFTEKVHDILYCYGVWQKLFDEMQENIPQLTFHEGLPSAERINAFTAASDHHRLIILDDMMHEVCKSEEMEKIFTQKCHHKHLSVIYITQNLYQQGKNSRSITLNSSYIILFQNIRDVLQVSMMGKQLYPGRSRMFVKIYEDAVKEPHSYLVLNLLPNTDNKYRMVSKIFPGEFPIVYVPNV